MLGISPISPSELESFSDSPIGDSTHPRNRSELRRIDGPRLRTLINRIYVVWMGKDVISYVNELDEADDKDSGLVSTCIRRYEVDVFKELCGLGDSVSVRRLLATDDIYVPRTPC